jgi:hypothetical protein
MIDTRHAVRNGFMLGLFFPGLAHVLAWHQKEGAAWFVAAVNVWIWLGFPWAALLHLASAVRMAFIMLRHVKTLAQHPPPSPSTPSGFPRQSAKGPGP